MSAAFVQESANPLFLREFSEDSAGSINPNRKRKRRTSDRSKLGLLLRQKGQKPGDKPMEKSGSDLVSSSSSTYSSSPSNSSPAPSQNGRDARKRLSAKPKKKFRTVEAGSDAGKRISTATTFIPPQLSEEEIAATNSRDLRMPAESTSGRDSRDTSPARLKEVEIVVDRPLFLDDASMSMKTKLSYLLKDIHESICDHRRTSSLDRSSKRPRKVEEPLDEELISAGEVAAAFEIDIDRVPKMSIEEVAEMVERLFGPDEELIELFRNEEIDGAGLVLMDMGGFMKLLKLPAGTAITLGGITDLARKVHGLKQPGYP